MKSVMSITIYSVITIFITVEPDTGQSDTIAGMGVVMIASATAAGFGSSAASLRSDDSKNRRWDAKPDVRPLPPTSTLVSATAKAKAKIKAYIHTPAPAPTSPTH